MENLFQFCKFLFPQLSINYYTAREYNEFDDEKTIVEIIQSHLDQSFSKDNFEDWRIADEEVYKINSKIDKFLRMFYLHTKMNGGLRAHKLDYWKNMI